ncbi:MAG TPA: hypothetical protein VMU05_09945, partial [Dongiaceae bacterium]|nr:hypothetical protein [Dongiaceae bacterium]
HCGRRTAKSFVSYYQRRWLSVSGPSWPLDSLQAIIQEGDIGRGGGDRNYQVAESTGTLRNELYS